MRLQGQGAKPKHGGQSCLKVERKAYFKGHKICYLYVTSSANLYYVTLFPELLCTSFSMDWYLSLAWAVKRKFGIRVHKQNRIKEKYDKTDIVFKNLYKSWCQSDCDHAVVHGG